MSPPVVLYRIGNWFYSIKLNQIGLVFSYLNRLVFSVWLPSSAKIGKNFTLGYMGLGTVIHSNTKIGDNCLIAQNVTIGRNFGDKKVPVIGNNVYIGAGSVVFGEITIGNNVIIGSNSVINKSVPNNAVVVGNPGRIIKYNAMPYYQLDNKNK